MVNIEDIERDEVSFGEFTDMKNITNSVINSVVKPSQNSLVSTEDKIVAELYNIFSFRPRKSKA